MALKTFLLGMVGWKGMADAGLGMDTNFKK